MTQQAALAINANNLETARRASAKRVRDLMAQWSTSTVEIGLELIEALEFFPKEGPNNSRPGWARWLRSECGIGENHASGLMNIGRKFGHLKGKRLPGNRVLRLLSYTTTPEAGVREVLRRVQRGEDVPAKAAKEIVDKHRPKPKDANKQAKETGKPVLASDGYLYFGASKEQARASEERRTVVYSVRRAVECLASVEVTPHQFLESALPHQLWNREDEKQIDRALKWLNALHAAWETRQ